MRQVRLIASALFYITRLPAIAYLATALHAAIALVFNTSSLSIIDDGKYFVINYPFTQNRFLLGDYDRFYIIEMISFLALYGIFFWLLGNIFKTYMEKKLFTPKGVKRLKTFYLVNFLAPLPFLILHITISYEVGTLFIITVLHGVLGVFAYFMAAIFTQGLKLQNEQDLFI